MSKPVHFSTPSAMYDFAKKVETKSEKVFVGSTCAFMATMGVGVFSAGVAVVTKGRIMPSVPMFKAWHKTMSFTGAGMLTSTAVGGVANFANNSSKSPFNKKNA
jgi:hypothetical protein